MSKVKLYIWTPALGWVAFDDFNNKPHDHTANLEDLLARCLPYVEEFVDDRGHFNEVDSAKYLITEIRKAVPWLKERDE